jgi:ATP-dependent 26S proteasome regulatory subunit
MSFAVNVYLKAGYPALYINTTEQERALMLISRDLKDSGLSGAYKVLTWKSTTGLIEWSSDNSEGIDGTVYPEGLLRYILGERGEPRSDCIYILLNLKEYMTNPLIKQLMRDAAYAVRTQGSHMILIGGHWEVPEELTDVVTFVDMELPNREEIRSVFMSVIDKYAGKLTEQASMQLVEQAADNALGLTEFKAENAISLSIVSSNSVDIPLIRKEKQLAVKQSGVLEYMPHSETLDTLGGFDVLKEHVSKRKKYFLNHTEAIKFGLRPPKGIMLTGIAGAGKTLAAKAVSSTLDLPLYKFDVGSVFKGLVGSSEATIRQALKLAETVAPCVLLIDEMEKLVAGLEGSGRSDSGTTSRVIGTLLSWMQETEAPVYKVATCNTIRNLDAALFRRGRWDAVFAVDLPTFDERKEIFAIHLRKRGRKVDTFDLDVLARRTEGFVGAEVESVVEEALYHAFDAGRELTSLDLQKVADSVVPVSKTDKEAIAAFRAWMQSRAMPVSSTKKASADLISSHRNLRIGQDTAKK